MSARSAAALSAPNSAAGPRAYGAGAPSDDWQPLLAAIRATVADCNIEAGEPLWSITTVSDADRLLICYIGNAARCLELSLRPETAILRCVYGCGAGGSTFELQAASGIVRLGGKRLTPRQAANLLLDKLVSGLD